MPELPEAERQFRDHLARARLLGEGGDPPAPARPRRRLRMAVRALLVLGLGGLILQAFGLRAEIARREADAVAVGQAQVEGIFDHFRRKALSLERRTKRLARDLESGAVRPDNLEARLKSESLKEPGVLGFTVAYEPNAYKPGVRLFAPYFDVKTGKCVQCEDFYDYTDPERRKDAVWYQAPAEAGEPVWVSAFGPAAGATYAGYSVPFSRGGKLAGVVNVSVSLDALSDLLNTRFVGRLGAGVMIDRRGVLLAGPERDDVRAGRTWEAVLRGSPVWGDGAAELVRAVTAGETGVSRFRCAVGAGEPRPGWFFYRPLEPSDWRIGVIIFDNELYRNRAGLDRRRVGLALTALACLSLFPLGFVRPGRLDLPLVVQSAAVFSVCGAGVVAYVWSLAVCRDADAVVDRPVADLHGVEAFVRERNAAAEQSHSPPPLVVPTRVLVRGVEFAGGHNVKVSGRVWMTFRAGEHDGLTRGFTLPDAAPDAESVTIEEVYRRKTDTVEVVGWHFRATLRQKFDYADFPFDSQTVAVTVAPADAGRNVLLVPELASYRYLNAAALPGVHRRLDVPGWTAEGSHFGYRVVPRFVDRGVAGEPAPAEAAELRFNVTLRREFLTPFISYIVPILLVTLLLYGVVVLSSVNQEKQNASGFNVFGVLGTCGAFFLTVALMHTDLRRGIDADVVTYLESLYFVSYLLLVAVSVNSLLFIATDSVRLVEYRDNLLAKLLYWPLFVALMLAVTLGTFY